jgi:uncharacterized membrane protein
MPGVLTNAAVWVAAAFEVAGVSVIVGGFVWALVRAAGARGKTGPEGAYVVVRNIFGRSVLLGLEVLVAADLVRTIAVAPTIDNLLALGLLVVIRTFLSWSFDVELEGMWPWQKREFEFRERSAGATPRPRRRSRRDPIVADGPVSDEQILRTLPAEVLAVLSPDQRSAIDRVLARLEAAEKVCEMVKVSLSPKLRQGSEKKLHWWDVGIAIKEWDDLPRH